MPDVQETATALSPEDSTRLIEFARALKAAARAVTLYPMGHPAIVATLGRIVEMTSSARMAAPLRITVLPSGLLLDERPPARADAAIAELAELLHGHVIGALTVNAGGDVEAWRNFLLLLGRAPDAVRAEGGIARVWATTADQHLELREIDYAQVLREGAGDRAAAWDTVIANCLQGDTFELDDEAIKSLLEVASHSDKLAALMVELETRAVRRRWHRRRELRRCSACSAASSKPCPGARPTASSRCCAAWRAPSASSPPTRSSSCCPIAAARKTAPA